MSDLIRRTDAIKSVEDLPNAYNGWSDAYDKAYIISTLEEVPKADRPQGKWKAKSFHEFFCNNCGFSFDMMKCEFLENMKYCPNCGVRKGADDE